jgi:chromosome segregation ATPase
MQSNAVLQFETWSREERSLRAASINVDRERKRMEESLQQLRVQHKQLSSDSRESADLLGRFHRDCGFLEQEKERLSRQLMEERAMLEQCSQHAKDLLVEGTSAKAAYCQKIGSIQTELSDVLYQQEAQLLYTMISTETVAALQDFLLELPHEPKNEEINALLDSLKDWTAIANSHENSMAEIDQWTKKVNGLRHQAMEIMQGTTVRGSIKILRNSVGDHENQTDASLFRSFFKYWRFTEQTLDDMERSWETTNEFVYHPPSSQDDSIAT